MDRKTVREVLGEPSTWSNSVTSTRRLPDMQDAQIVDIFCSGNEISVLTRSEKYDDTLSVFRIPNATDREGVIGELRPGRFMPEALAAAI